MVVRNHRNNRDGVSNMKTRITTSDTDSTYIVTMYENGSEVPTKLVITQKASGNVVIVDLTKES